MHEPPAAAENAIEIRIDDISQLFHTLDPSPFRERDLDKDAEEFIVSWARELPADQPFRIVVHLPEAQASIPETYEIAAAITGYFGYRARITMLDLKELFRVGWRALAIGLTVLSFSVIIGQTVVINLAPRPVGRVIEESLLIFGWVANWKPIENISVRVVANRSSAQSVTAPRSSAGGAETIQARRKRPDFSVRSLMAVGRSRYALVFADEKASRIYGGEARRAGQAGIPALDRCPVGRNGDHVRPQRPNAQVIFFRHAAFPSQCLKVNFVQYRGIIDSLPLLTVVNDNRRVPCMLFGNGSAESMFTTKLVLPAAIAFAISTTAAAQTPEGVPLLRTLPADGTTIANYYKQNVYNPADQKIGQIVDLVIKKDGAVPAAIVSVGGFLGIATKYVAVPFTALQAIPAERRPHLVLDTNKKALRNAPAFEFNRLTRRWERVEDD